MQRLFIAFLLLLAASSALAEVTDSTASGFTSVNTAVVDASPLEVYARLTDQVALWWSSAHTYSGDATHLRIEPTQGGCFCEVLPGGGSVRHLEVAYANPGEALRMLGGLGPLQATATTGSMTWQLSGAEDETEITVTYTVGGYVPQGLDTWAPAVDGVVGEQLERLARFINTGSPEPTEPAPSTGGSR